MDYIFSPQHYFREIRKEEIFENMDAPLEVDLGCGEGHFIEAMAAAHPERNFLAVERLQGRVKITANRLRKRGLTNAKVLRLETAYTVSHLLPSAGISRMHLICPDPWPKKKHAERRMVTRLDFLRGIERVLVDDGEFLLKTDNEVYYENALESMHHLRQTTSVKLPVFLRLPWEDDSFLYPETAFERQWLDMGRDIYRARWRKSPH